MKIKENSFFIAAAVIILVLFSILHPKISSLLFPMKRRALYTQFKGETTSLSRINSRSFWQFREFYSPGYAVFNKLGVDKKEANRLLHAMDKNILPGNYYYPYLLYYSPRIISVDSLVKNATLSAVVDMSDNTNCIVNNKTNYMCVKNNTVTIMFIKSLEEMKKTNGFFDYARDDVRKIVNDTHWLNITTVKLD